MYGTNVSGNWWDFTRDDSNGSVDIGSHSFGWFSTTLAQTDYATTGNRMDEASISFNTEIDFRDVNVSQGWWSYDFESVAVHEIGHVAGIHEHTTTSSSPMQQYHSTNTADRTLNSHDKATIRDSNVHKMNKKIILSLVAIAVIIPVLGIGIMPDNVDADKHREKNMQQHIKVQQLFGIHILQKHTYPEQVRN